MANGRVNWNNSFGGQFGIICQMHIPLIQQCHFQEFTLETKYTRRHMNKDIHCSTICNSKLPAITPSVEDRLNSGSATRWHTLQPLRRIMQLKYVLIWNVVSSSAPSLPPSPPHTHTLTHRSDLCIPVDHFWKDTQATWSLWFPLERRAIKVGAGVRGRQENYFFAKYSFLLLHFFCHMHILLQRHERESKINCRILYQQGVG